VCCGCDGNHEREKDKIQRLQRCGQTGETEQKMGDEEFIKRISFTEVNNSLIISPVAM
jgi:hypothetical protein